MWVRGDPGPHRVLGCGSLVSCSESNSSLATTRCWSDGALRRLLSAERWWGGKAWPKVFTLRSVDHYRAWQVCVDLRDAPVGAAHPEP